MSSRRLLLTVAIAFVIGSALKDFFTAVTAGLVTPIVGSLFPFCSADGWWFGD